jgi:predicted dehydrogenase
LVRTEQPPRRSACQDHADATRSKSAAPPPRREKLRLAVAGCGRAFERYHLPALRRSENWELVAACDPSDSRREWLLRCCPHLSVFDSLTTLLKDCSVDAVLVASSPDSHGSLSIEALRKGVDVLVEKPMALNVAEALNILRVASAAGRLVQVGFNRRFCAPYLHLRDRLAAIRIQHLRALHCEFQSGSWRRWTAGIGVDGASDLGIFEDIAVHQIDLLPWLVSRPVAEVRAAYRRLTSGRAASAEYDLRFDSGLVAHCRASYNLAFRERIAVELSGSTLWADRTGVFETRRLSRRRLKLFSELRAILDAVARRVLLRRSDLMMSFERQLDVFAVAARSETPPLPAADAASGARSIEILQACRDSLGREDAGRL